MMMMMMMMGCNESREQASTFLSENWVIKAIVLHKIMYALPVYFGYLTEG